MRHCVAKWRSCAIVKCIPSGPCTPVFRRIWCSERKHFGAASSPYVYAYLHNNNNGINNNGVCISWLMKSMCRGTIKCYKGACVNDRANCWEEYTCRKEKQNGKIYDPLWWWVGRDNRLFKIIRRNRVVSSRQQRWEQVLWTSMRNATEYKIWDPIPRPKGYSWRREYRIWIYIW